MFATWFFGGFQQKQMFSWKQERIINYVVTQVSLFTSKRFSLCSCLRGKNGKSFLPDGEKWKINGFRDDARLIKFLMNLNCFALKIVFSAAPRSSLTISSIASVKLLRLISCSISCCLQSFPIRLRPWQSFSTDYNFTRFTSVQSRLSSSNSWIIIPRKVSSITIFIELASN